MLNLNDDRVSKFQRQIYNWLKELYPSFNIELEKLIPSTNQRIDIYIHQLDLAIECDGSFHDKPVFFFVKTKEQWADIIKRDKLKTNTLINYGVDLIRIPYNHKFKNAQDLGKCIDEFYINKEDNFSEFNPEIFEDPQQQYIKNIQKQLNDKANEAYNNYKQSEEYISQKNEKNKQAREYYKQKRKEQYKRYKEKLKSSND